jgi:hypothetical protein
VARSRNGGTGRIKGSIVTLHYRTEGHSTDQKKL